MITSYSRRMSDYLYDIEIDDTTRFVNADRFCARAANICDWSLVRPCR
jgi:hypothetical protein